MKSEKTVSGNYAQALFELTQDKADIRETILMDLSNFSEAINQIPNSLSFLMSPAIAKENKKKIVETLKGKILPITANFLFLLIDKNRLNLLADIRDEFQKLINKSKGIVVAEVYSAGEIDVNTLESLKRSLEKTLGHNERIQLESKIEPSLVGGVKVRVNDLVFDGSVKGRLEQLKQKLS